MSDELHTGKLYVQCQNCQATMLQGADSEREAADMWNQRSDAQTCAVVPVEGK